MPELPEVEAVRRTLDPFFTRARIVDVEVRRPDLRAPFPRRFRARLTGQTVVSLERRAKYLLATLSSGDVLLVHLGMSGSFAVEAPGHGARETDAGASTAHDHVVFHLSSGAIVTFNDPAHQTDRISVVLEGIGPLNLSDELGPRGVDITGAGTITTGAGALKDGDRIVAAGGERPGRGSTASGRAGRGEGRGSQPEGSSR